MVRLMEPECFSSTGKKIKGSVADPLIRPAMKIEKNHEIDASEKDANGYYDYYYEYNDYLFSDETIPILARSYSDSPKEVSFRAVLQEEKLRMTGNKDMQYPLFQEAINYLKAEGKTDIQILTEGGYERVNI